ncbi:MAG: hypothetical protein ACJ73S_26205 [Mycobacteriales bacterium]
MAATTLLLGMGAVQFVGTIAGADAATDHVVTLTGTTAFDPVRWLVPRGDTVSFRNSLPALHLPGLSGQPQVRVQFTDGRTSLLLNPGEQSGPLQVTRETWYYTMPVLDGMLPFGLGDMGYLAPDASAPVVQAPTTAPAADTGVRVPPGQAKKRAPTPTATTGAGAAQVGADPGHDADDTPGPPSATPSSAATSPGASPTSDPIDAIARQDPQVPPAAGGGGGRPAARSAWLGGGLLVLLVLWTLIVRALLHERRRASYQ